MKKAFWPNSQLFSPLSTSTQLDSVARKLNIVLSNPAVLKVFCLQCDLFSLGKIYVYKDDKLVEDDPFLKLIAKPNPFDQQSQFLWAFMFWNMLGNSYVYVDSKVVDKANGNKLYILESQKIEFPTEFQNGADKILLSNASVREMMNTVIKYRYADGTTIDFKLEQLIHVPDISGYVGNRFVGPSRLDALVQVITNSEEALKSQNINLRYAGKFLVAGKQDPDNLTQLPMAKDEKEDIEKKMNGEKQVHAVKSMIDIKRFVEDMGKLQLPEQYLGLYYLVGSMYNIPRDVLEAYQSSTFENQEKARGAHVSYCLQPKGNLFMNCFESHFGYDAVGKNILIDWEHLPFMQAFAKERAETEFKKTQSLLNLQKAGVKLDEINKFLDTEFSELNPPQNILNDGQSTNEQGTSESPESGQGSNES